MSKMQKLNRTAVAAVLAASGIAVTAPYTVVKADSPFSDITTSNSHYDAIMQLYNRNIISGFEDGTFRASQTVTRGQAAKMLALVLGLDIKNVKNPKFKDVSAKSSYYPYIAALVEQDIISGYADNTYRPGEVITRNQMAKILVRGFQFSEASTLTHTFEDVSAKNANRFYIQTLVNLGITTGTSAIAFSPSKAVTRGQLASFIIRAENANVHNSAVKEITKVEQKSGKTYIYLNGVKHTVHSSLKDILNISNMETLRGAYIEGTIVGTEIRSLNKITFNAVGTSNNMLTFNGNGTTFRGAVVITGNHLRFQNWTLTGELTIEEAKQQAISNFVKPIALKTVASLQTVYDNIDWGTVTPPSVTESDENDGLIDIPTGPNRLPAMKNVAHNLKFENVKIRALVITANRTSIRSNQDLAHVTVAGYVREFEIFTDIGELYVESEENVTFYGVSDVEKLFKNSYKSVNLYADSVTKLIAADNASGWIDLGDYYYIDKIIIPPKTLPHDIFNDFLNDSDKIGEIEDPSGNEVDRDPIENGIVPDWEAPTLLIKDIKTNLATANITVNANEDGTVHYLVKKENDGEPSIREIMQYTGSMGGNKAVSAGQDSVISLTNLKDEQKYIFYAVAVDEAGNVSIKKSEAFEILDATPPNINPVQIKALPGGTRLEVTMTPDEPGEYFYYYELLPSLGVNTYTSAEILDFVTRDYRGQTGKGTVTQAGQMNFRITNLVHRTPYVVYVVMRDKAGNMMVETKVLNATTGELDLTPPRIDGVELKRNKDTYEFYFDVTEALDPVAANNPNNYELSGTAILNIEGQPTTIKPEYVNYVAGSKRVTIRIPSATALVNGDTIQVKVLPNVTDLAENPFSNINVEASIEDVRNTATYNHTDTLPPEITKQELIISPDKKYGYLQFDANKAGTYYYMIVADDFDWTGKYKEDFYEDFVKVPNPGLFPLGVDTVLSKYGDERNNAVLVGRQPRITIPIPETVNPFKSYSLHLILRDRSGNLSNMIELDLINDKKAPFINQLTVEPKEGENTIVKMTIGSSEQGQLYYKRVKKYVNDPANPGTEILNPELDRIKAIIDDQQTTLFAAGDNLRTSSSTIVQNAVAEIETWTPVSLNSGSTTYEHSGLIPHEDYVYYFAAEDLSKNLTLFPEALPATMPKSYANNFMKREVYTDGIDPFTNPIIKLIRKPEFINITKPSQIGNNTGIGDNVINHIPERTFIMTFSEAIKYNGTLGTGETDLHKLAAVIGTAMGVTVTDMEWEEVNNTWDERKLIFTVGALPTPSGDGIVKMNNVTFTDFKDLGNRDFELTTEAEYKARKLDLNSISYAQLDGNVYNPNNGIFDSATVMLGMELNVRNDVDQTYYYVTQNKDATALTSAEEVVNVAENNSYGGYTGIGITGKGDLISSVENTGAIPSNRLEIVTTTGVFRTDQRIYLVTVDTYGNIVGVQGGNLFVPISYNRPSTTTTP